MQQIWDEVGETNEERDKMLLQLEQECLEVYKRKVDKAVKSRAELLQTLADARVELANLLSALGEKTYIAIVRNFFFFQLYVYRLCNFAKLWKCYSC